MTVYVAIHTSSAPNVSDVAEFGRLALILGAADGQPLANNSGVNALKCVLPKDVIENLAHLAAWKTGDDEADHERVVVVERDRLRTTLEDIRNTADVGKQSAASAPPVERIEHLLLTLSGVVTAVNQALGTPEPEDPEEKADDRPE